MVDIPGLDDVGTALMTWCLIKCSAEKIDRHRRGVAGSPDNERTRFIVCFTRCISPVELPERSDDEQHEDEPHDDEQDEDEEQ